MEGVDWVTASMQKLLAQRCVRFGGASPGFGPSQKKLKPKKKEKKKNQKRKKKRERKRKQKKQRKQKKKKKQKQKKQKETTLGSLCWQKSMKEPDQLDLRPETLPSPAHRVRCLASGTTG